MNFNIKWGDLLTLIMAMGKDEYNERTKTHVRIARGAQFFQLDMRDGILPTPGLRKVWPRVAAAETAWQVLGHNHLGWLGKHTKMWDAFATEVDCECSYCGGSMQSTGVPSSCEKCDGTEKLLQLDFAYGYRWRKQFGRDQLGLAIEALQKNPSDRRIWVSSWHPGIDGLGAQGQKNVPCPVGFSLGITSSELHMAVSIRSSDVFVGLPYDVMNYAMLMKAIRDEITGISLGTLSFMLSNAHIYETHFEMAKKALQQQSVMPQLKMPFFPVWCIAMNPDAFVQAYATIVAEASIWPTFKPHPAVIL